MLKRVPQLRAPLSAVFLLAAAGCVQPDVPPDSPPPNLPVEVSTSAQEHLPCAVSPRGPGGYADGLPNSGVTFESSPHPSLGFSMPGLLVADLDNDGCSDLLFPVPTGGVELYWNECLSDGLVRFAPDQGSLASFQQLLPTVSAADVNGDGLLDLALPAPENPTLYLNMGGRSFEDHTDAYGLTTPLMFQSGISWADIDQDGDLDMLLLRNDSVTGGEGQGDDDDFDPNGSRGAGDDDSAADDDDSADQGDEKPLPSNLDGILANELWLNEDGRSFRAMAPYGPFAQPNLTQHAVWWDLDSDGDLELFEFNDFGEFANSQIWENLGPDSTGNVQWQERLEGMSLGILAAPMGAIVTDLNGDLQPDIWISDVNETRMFKNLGGTLPNGEYEWSFVDVGHGVWIDSEEHRWSDISWSVIRVDPDGDGKPEVFISYGWSDSQEYPGADQVSHIQQPDRVLVNQNDWGDEPWFVSDPSMLPVEPANAIGAATADLNRDGIGDLVVLNLDGPPAILLGKCTESSRLVVKLDDQTTLNRFGIGARVDVDIDGRVQSQVMGSDGQGSYSFSEPVLFFGTGGATEVDRITIRWPGPDSPTSELTQSCANCKLTIRRE